MALTTCPECGNKTSDTAASCPQCGFPMKDYLQYVANMKKRQEYEARLLEEEKEAERRKLEEERRLRNKPCPECGKVIGDVEICPFCGFNVKEKEARDAQRALELQEKQRAQAELRKQQAQETSWPHENQYGNQAGQGSQKYVPKCPTCGSPNVKQISGVDRVVSTSLWGPASKKINKTYKCNNCGFTW